MKWSHPDFVLIQMANADENGLCLYYEEIDEELDRRKPDEAYYHFGDCAGKRIFLPLDNESDVIVYDFNGEPV